MTPDHKAEVDRQLERVDGALGTAGMGEVPYRVRNEVHAIARGKDTTEGVVARQLAEIAPGSIVVDSHAPTPRTHRVDSTNSDAPPCQQD